MNEIASRFCFIEPDDIRNRLMSGTKVELMSGWPQYPTSGKVSFSQEPGRGDNGISWEQSFRAVVTDRSVMKYNGRQCYVGVFRTDGSFFIIGSATEVPVMSITPYENAIVVETSFETTEPVEI